MALPRLLNANQPDGPVALLTHSPKRADRPRGRDVRRALLTT